MKIANTPAAITAAQSFAERTNTCIAVELTEAGAYDYCPCRSCCEEAQAQAMGEMAAEMANERYFEDRGVCYGIPNYTDPQGGSCLCC